MGLVPSGIASNECYNRNSKNTHPDIYDNMGNMEIKTKIIYK